MNLFLAENSQPMRIRLLSLISEMDEVKVVGSASNALDAIESIRELKPDVVLLDIRMEKGNGLDVLKNIKASQASIKVIMMADHASPQYRKKCMEEKANYFFSKLTDIDLIEASLKEFVQKKAKERESDSQSVISSN